ncbi:MAG TPA: FtsX-like permease family protein, partial [Longimicrobiales bacterium]|nr:FtsX-like permease family protein [Longimicrobiales bacterium]
VPPGTGFSFGVELQAEGSPPPGDQPFWVPSASGDPDYLDVVGIDLLAGRPLTRADAGERNVLVDAPLARFLWGGESPLGRRFRMGDDGPWMTVVGVVEDLKLVGVDDRRGRYDILRARSDSTAAPYMSVAVRTTVEPSELVPAVRRTVQDLDPEQPVQDLRPASDYLAESIEKPRFLASLMVGLAGLALVLAGVGVYGVMAYAVSRRTRELGIRIALGAPVARVRRGVLARGMLWAGLGTAAGLALAWFLDDVVRSLLFAVEPRDPWTLSAGAALMLLAAGAASWIPARRATRVDPCEALRTE